MVKSGILLPPPLPKDAAATAARSDSSAFESAQGAPQVGQLWKTDHCSSCSALTAAGASKVWAGPQLGAAWGPRAKGAGAMEPSSSERS